MILTGFSYGQICMSSFSETKVALVKDPLYLLDKISLVEHPYLTNIWGTANSFIDGNPAQKSLLPFRYSNNDK